MTRLDVGRAGFGVGGVLHFGITFAQDYSVITIGRQVSLEDGQWW